MKTYTHRYHCGACSHEWTNQWSSEDTDDICPECGNGPIAAYQYDLDESVAQPLTSV